jgi:hypothetical protein
VKLEDLDDSAPPKADGSRLTDVRRRGRRLKRVRSVTRGLILAVIAVGCVAAVVTVAGRDDGPPVVSFEPTTTTTKQIAGAPTTFVSVRNSPTSNTAVIVAISDARTGKPLRTLLTLPTLPVGDGTRVSGTAIAPNGDVWITLNRGPSMRGHVNGGDPQPHSCASTLVKIDPRTLKKRTEPLGNDDVLVSDVQPSPTGDRIVYLQSGCATYYFDDSLRVEDLTTGRVVSVGAGLPRCHVIGDPRWTLDGRNIAFLYGAAIGPTYTGALGTCSQWGPSHLAVASAQRSQRGAEGSTAPAGPGCEVNAIAVTRDGYAGVEHCGSELFISGPTNLIRYDRALKPVSRSQLGQCENGASIAGNRTSAEVIISTYQFCGGNSVPEPTTKVFTDSGNGPRQVASIPGGYTAVDHIAY